jgi:hypothetical protein
MQGITVGYALLLFLYWTSEKSGYMIMMKKVDWATALFEHSSQKMRVKAQKKL